MIEDRSLERDDLLHGSTDESNQLLIVSREDPAVVLFSTRLLYRKLFAEFMLRKEGLEQQEDNCRTNTRSLLRLEKFKATGETSCEQLISLQQIAERAISNGNSSSSSSTSEFNLSFSSLTRSAGAAASEAVDRCSVRLVVRHVRYDGIGALAF